MPKVVKQEEEKPGTIYLKEKVTVKATGSNPFYKEGEEISMHPRIAEKGIKQGFYVEVKKSKD